MTDVRDTKDGHVCFGCKKQIGDGEPHIHVGLDEFGADHGRDALGLDDLLTFAFCEPCTQEGGRYHLEAHGVAGLPQRPDFPRGET